MPYPWLNLSKWHTRRPNKELCQQLVYEWGRCLDSQQFTNFGYLLVVPIDSGFSWCAPRTLQGAKQVILVHRDPESSLCRRRSKHEDYYCTTLPRSWHSKLKVPLTRSAMRVPWELRSKLGHRDGSSHRLIITVLSTHSHTKRVTSFHWQRSPTRWSAQQDVKYITRPTLFCAVEIPSKYVVAVVPADVEAG